MSALSDAALAYAASDRLVFPARRKQPLTRHGCLDATTDESIIRAWWRRWPQADICVATGRGLVALDVDGLDGEQSLRRLEDTHGQLPAATVASTPRGGRHLFFRTMAMVPCSAGRVGSNLDVRGDGGYVVVPPGEGRQWVRTQGLTWLPDWLLKLAGERLPGVHTKVPLGEWAKLLRAGVDEGQRNVQLTRIVGHWLSGRLEPLEVYELAHIVTRQWRPPMEPAEVDRVLDSIARRELRKGRA
jgi:hypothetical protein